ncbi:MAG: ABC transporter substrate-binding protein [Kineosporiaceae bacterium]
MIPVAVALMAAGCSSSGSDSTAGPSIVIDSSQPENPLVPGNTNETGGGKVVDALFTGLVEYAADDAATQMAVAESIESSDAKTFTIKLKEGWKFHDGTPVTSDSFINAWNWVAYGPNGALNSYFMEKIDGYADLQSEDPDGEEGPQEAPAPAAKEMKGLKKIDDTSFEVTLSAPFGAFETTLGYTAFSPLPQSFFDAGDDKTAWGKNPVGNGPFKFVGWTDNQEIKITRNDDYTGTKPKVKDVTFRLYQNQDAAYSDLLSDNLDFQQQLPTAALAGGKWKTDLGDRGMERPVLVVQTITMPIYAGAPYDNADFRHGLSMAIDRDTITQQIFDGTRAPAKAFSSPAVNGYEETCGEYCTYNPDKAKELVAKSGFSGKVTLSYNADGDHKAWTEAVCNSITKATSLECQATPVATFAAFRQGINDKKMTGLFRAGWQYDYPNIQNGLEPLYATGGSANDSGYSNPAFDEGIAKANQASVEESNALYIAAEKTLVADMPAIPLWTVSEQSGISTKLKTAKVNVFGELDLVSVEVK